MVGVEMGDENTGWVGGKELRFAKIEEEFFINEDSGMIPVTGCSCIDLASGSEYTNLHHGPPWWIRAVAFLCIQGLCVIRYQGVL
jgi:hypothetical protein